MRKILIFLLYIFPLFFVPTTFAATNSFVSIVNPVRGNDFWDVKDQKPETAVLGQIAILNKFNLPATWLLRFDALGSKEVIDAVKNRPDEKGLFLEITPSWAKAAGVSYRQSDVWHNAASAFLTGYETGEREKLLTSAFEKFKRVFGYYPASVGAWWLDAYSLGYMQKKFGITSALIVADQYSTDNYQIWGQYFSTPYYPDKNNALHPAQSIENKLNVVMMQWAARDPVNSYGNGVSESTFSLQANDYLDYHNLDITYFSKLLDIYTKQQFNRFAHLVVGLENSYSWNKYADEYQKQIETLSQRNKLYLRIMTMADFAKWYKNNFPNISEEQIIIADDPLGSYKKVVWYMNPYYRAGWFLNDGGSVFRDIRQYIAGEEELCFKKRCDSVNFATSATRVLDDVSFGTKWEIDGGKIRDFKIEKKDDEFVVSYLNEAGTRREIGFLPRDLRIDEKISSIDTAILNVLKTETPQIKNKPSAGNLKWSIISVFYKTAGFLIFFFLAITPLSYFVINRFYSGKSCLEKLFLSAASGLVFFTSAFYLFSLFGVKQYIFLYAFINLVIFWRFKIYKVFQNFPPIKNKLIILVITAGVLFQAIPTFKSGLNFGYGTGFWGPNSHDGFWHLGLVNQLLKSVPPQNPIYAGESLKNYHFFYDLLTAGTAYLTHIPAPDLLFRFYPILFSLLLGLGSYYLIKSKTAAFWSLYLIYFGGSFGWIVEFLRERHFGGESAFWVNQSVSFNLNPPYAISLVLMIAVLHLISSEEKGLLSKLILILIAGILASFKSYTGVLVLAGLFATLGIRILRGKDFSYLWVALFSLLITVLLFLSNFQASSALVVFTPFWFIHSMVDSPDRVGWVRLSLARTASYALKQWPKFIMTETVSIALFIFGNLGMRFFALGSLIKIKQIFRNDFLLFIFILTFISVIVPVLFIQSGNPWNTIQFFYPALYTTALLSGSVIAFIISKTKKIAALTLTALILVIAPVNSLVTAGGYLTNAPHAYIPAGELEALEYLHKLPDGIILTYPFDEKLKERIAEPWPILAYDSTAYVSAYSAKASYLEDLPQNQILLTDYKKRLAAVKDFYSKPLSQAKEFLKKNNIRYIYLPLIYKIRLDESEKIVKNIFENIEAVVYEVDYGR